MDLNLGTGDVPALRADLDAVVGWSGARVAAPTSGPAERDGVRLATWRLLLDSGRLQEGEPHLAATARPTQAWVSAATAEDLGLADDSIVTVTGPLGSVSLPVRVTDMVDGAIWLPGNSPGCSVVSDLGCGYGSTVTVGGGNR
jgi:NADH-quinone oxidoreductase subunit G